jgi:Holliday junction resolvasome RuvABC endonuclease subunit
MITHACIDAPEPTPLTASKSQFHIWMKQALGITLKHPLPEDIADDLALTVIGAGETKKYY